MRHIAVAIALIALSCIASLHASATPYQGNGRLFPDELSKEGLPYAIPCIINTYHDNSTALVCTWLSTPRNIVEWDPQAQRNITYNNRMKGYCRRGKCNTDTYQAGFYPQDTTFIISLWYYIYTNEDGQAVAYVMGTGPGFKGEAVSYREAGNILHQFYLDANLTDEEIVYEMDRHYTGGYAAWKTGDTAVTPKTSGDVVSAHCAPQQDDSCYVNDVKVPKADLGQYLPVVQEATVGAAGGYCDYPICYDKSNKPVGIREGH